MKSGDGSLEIRSALAGDAASLSGLFTELGFRASASDVADRLKAMSGATLVAVRDGHVVGLITTNIMPVLHRPTSVGRLSALVVSKQERHRGLGRLLVASAEQMLKQSGCELAEVTSNLRLEEAHSFFRHLGYESTSIRFKKDLRDA